MTVARDEARDPLDARHLGPAVLARYVREHGLTANRRLSQNFLADGEVLDAIVAEARVTPGRRILEIGPGPGILTGALLAAGADVTAVEVDRRMVAHLRDRFGVAGGGAADGPLADGHLRLVEGDALDEDLAALIAAPWDLVANLPYHITSPTLHHVLGAEPRPERFVLMLQREVAERIAAPPGGLSYLSVFVQYHARVRVARIVPPQAFEPAPEVASAVLVGETRPRRLDPARGGGPVAARPGRLPRAAQDAPQRPAAPAAGRRAGDARGGPGPGGDRRPSDARRRSRWRTGWPSRPPWGRCRDGATRRRPGQGQPDPGRLRAPAGRVPRPLDDPGPHRPGRPPHRPADRRRADPRR